MTNTAVRRQYEAALTAAGISYLWTTGVFEKPKYGRLVFGPGAGGQAASRTRAAEAFVAYLQRCGWPDVTGWYQMD